MESERERHENVRRTLGGDGGKGRWHAIKSDRAWEGKGNDRWHVSALAWGGGPMHMGHGQRTKLNPEGRDTKITRNTLSEENAFKKARDYYL